MSTGDASRQTEAWEGIASRFASCPRFFLACDLDALFTPAPLIGHRAGAAAARAEELILLLEKFAAGGHAEVAILSGRSLPDVRKRVGLENVSCVANHGLEVSAPGTQWSNLEARSRRTEIADAVAMLRTRMGALTGGGSREENDGWRGRGSFLESCCGSNSVSDDRADGFLCIEDYELAAAIYCEGCPATERERLREAVWAVTQAHPGVEPSETISGWELRLRGDWNKGRVVERLISRCGLGPAAAIYIGGDASDEKVFRALPQAATFRLGDTSATAAQYRLRDHAAMASFLFYLLNARLTAARTWPNDPRPVESLVSR